MWAVHPDLGTCHLLPLSFFPTSRHGWPSAPVISISASPLAEPATWPGNQAMTTVARPSSRRQPQPWLPRTPHESPKHTGIAPGRSGEDYHADASRPLSLPLPKEARLHPS